MGCRQDGKKEGSVFRLKEKNEKRKKTMKTKGRLIKERKKGKIKREIYGGRLVRGRELKKT